MSYLEARVIDMYSQQNTAGAVALHAHTVHPRYRQQLS